MKKSGLGERVDRRAFLKGALSLGGAAMMAGVPSGVLAQEGKKRIPEISVLYYVVHQEQEDILKLVIQDWKRLGLDFKLSVAADPVALKRMFTDRDYGHIGFISWGPNMERLDPNFHLYEQLHSSQSKVGGRNFGYYSNPEYDKYCDLQMTEMDRNKRKDHVWKCQEIAAKDYPVWWIGYAGNIQAYNSRDWEGVWPMPGGGIGTMFTPWTFIKIKTKTKNNKIRVADYGELVGTNIFEVKNSQSQSVLRWIYDTYTKINPDMETVPWAAESWKVVNPKTVDIILRSGMKFHDGNPVTVQDVKFTWDYTKKWKFPLYAWVSDTVERTEILNDRSVRFHLVKPHAPFIDQTLTFAIILPKHIWETIPESAGLKSPLDWDNPKCIGSGFFKFGYLRKSEEVYLEANKQHWSAPKIDGIYFRENMSPDAMVSALIAGEVDILGGDIRLSQTKELERYNYLTVVKNPSHRIYAARPDMQKKPFDDKEFRRAFYHAVNLKKIHEVVFEGVGFEGKNTPISPMFKFWNNSKIPPIDFSIDKARKILSDAGYSWDNDGRLCFPKGA